MNRRSPFYIVGATGGELVPWPDRTRFSRNAKYDRPLRQATRVSSLSDRAGAALVGVKRIRERRGAHNCVNRGGRALRRDDPDLL